MTSIGLNTGLRALLTSQFVLDTIGHNLANANTPGYSRQRVQLDQSLPLRLGQLLIGNGVNASAVRRTVDTLLDRRITGRLSGGGGLDAQLSGLGELEALFNEPGENGLGASLDRFFTGLSELSGSPGDPILLTGAVQEASSLAERFHGLAGGMNGILHDLEATVRTRIDEANDRAAEIAALNVRIGELEAGGVPANDLRDNRDRALRALSRLVEVQVIEEPRGSIRVQVAGNTLVGSAQAHRMELVEKPTGDLAIRIEGAAGFVALERGAAGAIGGLLELGQRFTPALLADVDQLARNLILEMNRVHSTGIPPSGSFSSLLAENRVLDLDRDGKLTDELLSNAGLPFDVSSGTLAVNVIDEDSGAVVKHSIAISRTHTTVGSLIESFNSIPEISADLDSFGRLKIVAANGKRFDFSSRVDSDPDEAGTFGGGHASLGTANGPFALADGDVLTLTVDPLGTPVTFDVAFAGGDFGEISQATAAEIAAVVNADVDAQTNGIRAVAVGDALFLQSVGEGAGVSFEVAGGAASAALGWTPLLGVPVSGQATSVDARVGGAYTGEHDERFTFVPSMDGDVGSTDGLEVAVFNRAGEHVATLDVGAGYTPGTELAVAEGITVAFGAGELSATHGDRFDLALTADPDTADALVALGLNPFFVGGGAGDIAVRADIADDPKLLALSGTGGEGDNRLLLQLLDVQEKPLTGLGGETLSQFYGDVVGDLGFRTASVTNALESNEALVSSLELRRQAISGVNVDEELVDLLQFEQSFAAAAQFITVINELNDELLSLI